MTVQLVLEGKYTPDKRQVTDMSSRRLVSIDIEDESTLNDIQYFSSKDPSSGLLVIRNVLTLGNDKTGWWRIKEIFEDMPPTVELHEGSYPVSYSLSEHEFMELVDVRRNKHKKDGKA